MWFSVVCTLIDNYTRHHSSQNVVDSRGAAKWVTRIVVDKSTDHAKTHFDLLFYHNIDVKEKIVSFSERELKKAWRDTLLSGLLSTKAN